MKRQFWVLSFLALAGAAAAGTFSANLGQGVSYVDAAGGDYTSLAQAAQDFNSYAPGCSDDYTLYVRSNLTEPNNVAFGNNTNGHHFTIKPAPLTTPVITFTTTTAAPATLWEGALVIGAKSGLANNLDNMTTTSNFTIDGSNAVNGTTRDMTIISAVNDTSSTVLCRVVGACDSVALKNLKLENVSSGTVEAMCVDFSSRKVGAADYHPSNGTVLNCLLRAKNSPVGEGIRCRQFGDTAGTVQQNMNFTSNTVETTYYGITMVANGSAVMANNTFDIFQSFSFPTTPSTDRPQAVEHYPYFSTGWTVDFTGNKFLRYGNVNYTFCLPELTIGFSAAPNKGTYNINNNFFGGFDYVTTTVVTSQQSLRAIQIAAANDTFNMYHNSFNNPDISYINGNPTSTGYDRLVPLSMASTGFSGTLNFKDNIVRFEQHNGVVFYLRSPNTGTFNIDYNAYYLGAAGAKMASWNAAAATTAPNYATFASWQAAGFDAHSIIANPTAVVAGVGKWVSNSDMHFDGPVSSVFTGTNVGITTDIDGQARTVPIMGADELGLASGVTAASDWALFE